MTTTCTRTNPAVAEWARLFTVSAAENYTNSILFMKQLTTIAVSTITFTQKIFPEENYTDETFAGVKIQILKKQCSDEAANSLSAALTRAYDAFNKKYLHKLVLNFYANECNLEDLIESIEFEYSYDAKGGMMNICSKNQIEVKAGRNISNIKENVFEVVRKRTIKLLKTCMVKAEEIRLKTRGSVTSANVIDVQLYYTNETPADYQVAGFERAEEDEDHLAMAGLDTIGVVALSTPYHAVITKLYCAEPVEDSSNNTAIESQSTLLLSNEADVPELPETSDLQGVLSDGTSGRAKLECFCKKYEDEDLINATLIQCQYCGRQQHSVCYGVLEHHAPLIRHCCLQCHAEDTSRSLTDYTLAHMDTRTRQNLANCRRVLAYCSHAHSINAARLRRVLGYSQRSADLLMKELYSWGIVPNDPRNDSSLQDVKLDLLNIAISKYFNRSGTILTQDSYEEPTHAPDILSTSYSNSQPARAIDNSQSDPGLLEYQHALRTIDNVDETETSIAECIKKSVKRSLDDTTKRGRAKIVKVMPK